MKKTLLNASLRLLALTVAAALPTAQAQGAKTTFPEKGKTIQIIVGYAAGGSTDVGARLLAQGLEKELGVPVVVVNRPGAGGQVGYTALTQAKPDGYTLGTVNFPSAVITYLDPARQATYTRNSFIPLAQHVSDPSLLAVSKSSPYKTLKEVINAAKANPGKLTVSTTGLQTGEHFAIVQLEKLTGAKFALVHFSQGAASATTALLGNKIDLFVGNVGDLLSQYKTGDVRILGVMDKQRSGFYPNVPTFEASGYKLYSVTARGYALPAGTPPEVVKKLSRAIQKVLSAPDHVQQMKNLGLTVKYQTPEKFSAFWKDYETNLKELMPLTKQ